MTVESNSGFLKHIVSTQAALEKVIGKTPAGIDLKVIDHLDGLALNWLAASPLAFLAFGNEGSIQVTLGGGQQGFTSGDGEHLRFPLDMLDNPELARPGHSFASLFLAPGIGETLRINGRVVEIVGGEAVVGVMECYAHCAKALIRSDFWNTKPVAEPPKNEPEFMAACRFMGFATMNSDGAADLSPKGDPAGTMVQFDGDALWFADRPGNRRVDSFRNILEQPRVSAALLIPGYNQIISFEGRTSMTTDAAARSRFVVKEKIPHLAIRVDDLALSVKRSEALARASLWPLRERAESIDPAKVFAGHVKLNKHKGLGARVAGALLSIPGMMEKGLEQDYKKKLY